MKKNRNAKCDSRKAENIIFSRQQSSCSFHCIFYREKKNEINFQIDEREILWYVRRRCIAVKNVLQRTRNTIPDIATIVCAWTVIDAKIRNRFDKIIRSDSRQLKLEFNEIDLCVCQTSNSSGSCEVCVCFGSSVTRKWCDRIYSSWENRNVLTKFWGIVWSWRKRK